MTLNIEEEGDGLANNKWQEEFEKMINDEEERSDVEDLKIWRTNEQAVHLVIVVHLALKHCALHIMGILYTL